MLASIWSNWNPRTLLAGVQTGTTSLENSLAVPQNVSVGLQV
jgi:hypothetical protein